MKTVNEPLNLPDQQKLEPPAAPPAPPPPKPPVTRGQVRHIQNRAFIRSFIKFAFKNRTYVVCIFVIHLILVFFL